MLLYRLKLIKNALKALAKTLFMPFRLKVKASAKNAAIRMKNQIKENTFLILSYKLITSLDDSGFLIIDVTRIVENEAK